MSTEIKHKVSNPGPLGLLGFGMTTVLLNLHNAGQIINEEYGKTIIPLG